MIKIGIKENKGITLITLMIAIIIMVVISSIIIYNAQTGSQTRALNNMYNDIKALKDKIDIYYSQYGTLPVVKELYTNVDSIKEININDNNNYYVIDLELLDNLTLTYGKDYTSYKTSPSNTKDDLYIINEKSHTTYYVKGVTLDGKIYYTVPGEYTKVDTGINCNHPKLGTGMTPVKWNETEFVDTTSYDSEWYAYTDTSIEGKENTSKWANARTKDGSMWVWIPRYAYKITYTNPNDKSQGGTIDVVFLKNDTNYDFNDKDVTSSSYVDENGNTGAYIVHPAFQDGIGNNFANGEWDKEITGFWMAKFEAGYAGNTGDPTSAQNSEITLSTTKQWNGSTTINLTVDYYGTREEGTILKYPVFMANKPSMNNIPIADAYNLSQNLISSGNPYGLTSNVDSHLTKNSEWGAVAYLTHSKYGRNGEEVTINNVSANNENTIYSVTGYAGATVSASEDITRNLATLTTANQSGSWTTPQGQTASSTGNIYGIYDLSGGTWEWTAGYIATTDETDNYNNYGGSLKGESNKYKSKYVGTSSTDTENYNENPNPTRLGEAIWETSSAGTGLKSWNKDYSDFWYATSAFSIRGGRWGNVSSSGIFAFRRENGSCNYCIGFRPVLVAE